jgi:two-component system, chemotaxis family, protein-glutamate methylesterase/glutaminase
LRKIRVLIVDDSAIMRKILADTLAQQPDMLVVGTCEDGTEVGAAMDVLKPDVITLDLEMPKLDGPGVLKFVIRKKPIPVLVVSSMSAQGANATLECLALGASDFVLKPSGLRQVRAFQEFSSTLVYKIRQLAMDRSPSPPRMAVRPRQPSNFMPPLIAIGASTGGPRAIEFLLKQLSEFCPPVVICLHMPQHFTQLFAARLAKSPTGPRAVLAVDGMALQNGYAYLCPGDFNLTVNGNRSSGFWCNVTRAPSQQIYRPSVDALFESVAHAVGSSALICVLTGMGRDGLAGARAVNKKGGLIITQNAQTSVIYGMPKVVDEAGLSDLNLALEEIPVNLNELTIGAHHE